MTMKGKEDLKESIRRIDHKSYGMYKTLAGSYRYGEFILHIDHVQGDPFASPSRLRIEIPEKRHGFPGEYYQEKHRRIAAEDRILRVFHRHLRKIGAGSPGGDREDRGRNRPSGIGGSGKSGRITTCPVGQTVLERIAVCFTQAGLEFRFELGFPARGRTILGREMTELVNRVIPELVLKSFFYNNWTGEDREMLKKAVELADDQQYIRNQLADRKLIAFAADGSRLPRESGVSDRPMRDCVPLISPESLRVEIDLPHRGKICGMGIPEGITVIVGGGYHGKSTLLKALEQGVYNHIAGDGREYVIARDDAVKIRAEDGRSVKHSDISLFIRNLPNGQDTRDFSTDNASGSTSQAANLVEALEAESGLLLLDEDTSATNFMIRDRVMAMLVSDDKEPITTLLKHIKTLSCRQGISFVIVIGSSGDYLSVADTVLMMERYQVKDVSKEANKICRAAGLCKEEGGSDNKQVEDPERQRMLKGAGKTGDSRMKLKAMGTDTVMIDREPIDVRYLEQLSENGQTICLAYLMGDLLQKTRNPESICKIIDDLYARIEEKGLLSLIPRGYSCGHPVYVRKQELYACLNRYRKAGIIKN